MRLSVRLVFRYHLFPQSLDPSLIKLPSHSCCSDAEVPPVLLAVVPEDLVEEEGEEDEAGDHGRLAVLLVLCVFLFVFLCGR